MKSIRITLAHPKDRRLQIVRSIGVNGLKREKKNNNNEKRPKTEHVNRFETLVRVLRPKRSKCLRPLYAFCQFVFRSWTTFFMNRKRTICVHVLRRNGVVREKKNKRKPYYSTTRINAQLFYTIAGLLINNMS